MIPVWYIANPNRYSGGGNKGDDDRGPWWLWALIALELLLAVIAILVVFGVIGGK